MLIPALCSLSSAELEYACSTQRNSPQAVQAWRHLETFGQLVDALPKARTLEVSVQGLRASQWVASDTLLLAKANFDQSGPSTAEANYLNRAPHKLF